MSPNHQDVLVEQYRKKIYQIAWNIQYKTKRQKNREIFCDYDSFQTQGFADRINSRLFVSQLIEALPLDTGKVIMYNIYIKDKTEAQISKELGISQQAVSKWKKKTLQKLYQTLISKDYLI